MLSLIDNLTVNQCMMSILNYFRKESSQRETLTEEDEHAPGKIKELKCVVAREHHMTTS